MERRLAWRLLGVAATSPSSPSMHFLFTGPRGEGRRVMGERERREAQPRRVGEEEGEGEKERLGTGICIEGEKHCLLEETEPEDRVGDGEGEARGEGKGPTPMVSGVMGSLRPGRPRLLGLPGLLVLGDGLLASLLSLKERSSQL